MSSFSGIIGKMTGQPPSHVKKSQYQFGKTLGAGTFGVVKQAKVANSNEDVAIKIILKKTLKGNEKMVYDEIQMLEKLHHPHIVSFKDFFESKEKFYIVTQLATGGELFDRICEYGKFTEQDASRCMKDVLEAIDYLHDRDIVHRDLKPENLLYVTPELDSELVLADFGIAKTLNSPQELLTSMAGSFGYAAPEVLKASGHGKPCDIWSLGVITYTLLCGYSPFRSENVPDFLEEVSGDYKIICHERYWRDVSHEARDFVQSMMQVDPAKRPSVKELLKSKWISGENDNTNDLLPAIREGFNARAKFRKAIEAVRLANRIKVLQMDDDSDDEDDASSTPDTEISADSKSKILAAFGKKRTSTTNSATSDSSRTSSNSTKGSGARFHEVVLAAARNKELLKEES